MARYTACLVQALIVMALAVAGAAQKTVKPWMQWTLQDAQKILDDSAWGQTQINTENTVSTPGAIEVQRVNLRVRFLSAKPIRQALLRILELSPGKATPEQIEEMWGLMDRKYDRTIVIAVNWDGKDRGMIVPIMQAFNTAVTATLKNQTYLEIKGGKRLFLQEYQPPGPDGLGAKFIFPRHFEDELFINPKAEWVRFFMQFPKSPDKVNPPPVMPMGSYPSFVEAPTPLSINLRFKIRDFEYNGIMEY
jgi:hypothetical protein